MTANNTQAHEPLQRINRSLGDAAEMTRVLDEPTLVADDAGARPLEVREGIERDVDVVLVDTAGRLQNKSTP